VRDLATSVVMTLMEGHLDAGRTLSTDNFYTSVPLAETLLGPKTHLVGTVWKNRKGLPPKVISSVLKVGETVAQQNHSGVVVQKWRDNREALTLSKHADAMIKAPGDKREKNKPEMVVYYNRTKQGIDVSDQIASYHTSLRKTIRWYHKLAMELILGTAVVNAAILYNQRQLESGLQRMKIASFRGELCQVIVTVEKR